MNKYKKYTIFGVAVNLVFYLLGTTPQVSAATCDDSVKCSGGFHTMKDHYLKSADGKKRGNKKVYVSPSFSQDTKGFIGTGYLQWNKCSEEFKLVGESKETDSQIRIRPKKLDAYVYGMTYIRKNSGELTNDATKVVNNYTVALIDLDEEQCTTDNYTLKVATHEVGHALGLSHVTCKTSVMYPNTDAVQMASAPTTDDGYAVAHIYK